MLGEGTTVLEYLTMETREGFDRHHRHEMEELYHDEAKWGNTEAYGWAAIRYL